MTLSLKRYLNWSKNQKCLGDEMVDMTDSKSVARKGVPVRVRPEAPLKKPSF